MALRNDENAARVSQAAHVNGRPDRAAEILSFGLAGRVIQGEVFYGVAER